MLTVSGEREVCVSSSSDVCCQGEPTQPKVDGVNASADNDEVSLRLRMFVEKLDAEKTALANKLHEEQRCV